MTSSLPEGWSISFLSEVVSQCFPHGQLWVSNLSKVATQWLEAVSNLQQTIWSQVTPLTRHGSCGYMVTTSWIRSIRLTTSLHLRFPNIQFSTSACDLRIVLDRSLAFTNQVYSISRSCFYHMCQLRSLRRSLTLHGITTLVQAMTCTWVNFGHAV